MMIARMGGLAAVPVYNFSWKGPSLLSDLVQRSYQSFYPSFQHLVVSGKHKNFLEKHSTVGMLILGLALCAAGCALAFNHLVVQALAGDAFFAGAHANTAFALAMIVVPISGFFRILLPISGNLGKGPLVAMLQLPFFIVSSVILWHFMGLAGIALAFAMSMAFKGIYAYVRSPESFEFEGGPISRNVAMASFAAMTLVIATGIASSHLTSESGMTISILGRMLVMPSFPSIILNLIPTYTGIVITLVSIRKLFQGFR